MFVDLRTEVAKYTNLKSLKQNQTEAKCQSLQWPFLPIKWPGVIAKVITVSSGTKRGFNAELCAGAHEGLPSRFGDPLLGLWALG